MIPDLLVHLRTHDVDFLASRTCEGRIVALPIFSCPIASRSIYRVCILPSREVRSTSSSSDHTRSVTFAAIEVAQAADALSYVWDEIIQKTAQNTLDGTLLGNSSMLRGERAIQEMAKEPVFRAAPSRSR
jgi:hypothetical protein